ncbi:MAG: hypothetical protein OXU20_17075, partial [Myxococcales bacterium]|nr:hypothetical protein [Myxococcales bacterium]
SEQEATPSDPAPPAVGRPRPRSVERASAAPASGANLSAQVDMLDHARGALTMGRTGRVLAIVARFHARFPDAALSPDADLLALEALATQGANALVRTRARAFLENHPYDPHIARVRAILRQASAR